MKDRERQSEECWNRIWYIFFFSLTDASFFSQNSCLLSFSMSCVSVLVSSFTTDPCYLTYWWIHYLSPFIPSLEFKWVGWEWRVFHPPSSSSSLHETRVWPTGERQRNGNEKEISFCDSSQESIISSASVSFFSLFKTHKHSCDSHLSFPHLPASTNVFNVSSFLPRNHQFSINVLLCSLSHTIISSSLPTTERIIHRQIVVVYVYWSSLPSLLYHSSRQQRSINTLEYYYEDNQIYPGIARDKPPE